MVTIKDALYEGQQYLRDLPQPYLEASLLLAKATNIKRSLVYANLQTILTNQIKKQFIQFLQLRKSGVPSAYIVGEKEFYGHNFVVDSRCLIPRPETEYLVQACLEIGDAMLGKGILPIVHDLCTGSGCIIISLALARVNWQYSASDISSSALAVAKENAARLLGCQLSEEKNTPVQFYKSFVLQTVPGTFSIITANPPYLNTQESETLARKWGEPTIALDGGSDGMSICNIIIQESFHRLQKGGALILEMDSSMASSLSKLLQETGYSDIIVGKDLAGCLRYLIARKP